ncbi:hypothetical protein GCM10015535_26480 [Streptomyces gelaticus]|uniref:Uncharacterized protein n=1 Tax=Streptomyces gelaticus TaxID=285446 RepID=A0ABQ2VZP5_9ACTN|nr:hypothetical protein GCM10015535_26480 [Streptomyces gelaticus]
MTRRSPGKRAASRARRAGVASMEGTRRSVGSGDFAHPVLMKASRAGDTGRSWLPVCGAEKERDTALLLGALRGRDSGSPGDAVVRWRGGRNR